MKSCVASFLALLASAASVFASATDSAPPSPPREFRGVWIATVKDIDWPSRPGLPAGRQQAELRGILDRAAASRLNAVILQVRPNCDAFYESTIEPWSEDLTGVMGQPPSPYYDPLAFAVTEAHRRGLELHAWFNPFRVREVDDKSREATNFVRRRHPDLVVRAGKYYWLDPGQAEARDYSLSVIMDVAGPLRHRRRPLPTTISIPTRRRSIIRTPTSPTRPRGVNIRNRAASSRAPIGGGTTLTGSFARSLRRFASKSRGSNLASQPDAGSWQSATSGLRARV